MGFSILVAVDQQRGIGRHNQLPWKLKADMQWFKNKTTAEDLGHPHAVIMGRKTWDSLPPNFRPLPHRVNIVISRHPEQVQAEHVVSSFEAALTLAYQLGQDVFVIGGSSIYEQAFNHPELVTCYITEIDRSFDCDTFFPDYSHLHLNAIIAQGQEAGLSYQIKAYQP